MPPTKNNLTRDEARRRAGLLSSLMYQVSLDLTQGDETFACDTTIQFLCAEPGATTFVDFLGPSVQALQLNGRELPREAFDGSRIHLPDLRAANELHVQATGAYQHTGAGLSHFRDPVDRQVYLHTQFESFDAHRVYPCFDQPDLKATFDFTVLAPTPWHVISNSRGTRRSAEGGDGRGRWTFATTPRIPTYITAIVTGPFHEVRERHREIELGLYCRQSLAPYLDAAEIFEITRQGLDYYEKVFETPYAFGKYDQLFVPEFAAGAMENAGCVTHNEFMIFRSKVTEAARERRAETILHEMAHMWFGDLVTMRWWDDLWLNESFATFMAQLSQVHATRFRNAWTTFANQVKTSARRQDQLPTTHPIAADVPDIETVYLNFDSITYEKGASVLRQLVAWVGEETFLRSLRGYFRHHAFGNATLADFLQALESGSGRNLRAWSQEWLETAGLNTMRALILPGPDGQSMESVGIVQEAPPEWPALRSHRLAVGLYDLKKGRLVRRRRIELDVTGATTRVPELTGERLADLVLLNDGDLDYTKIRLDPRSLDTVTHHLAELPDSLARALCWGAAWDMLRDAELPARAYLQLVLRNLRGEDDIGVVQDLLSQSAAGVHLYGAPANAQPALRLLADHALDTLKAAKPGGDLQLAWTRAFIGAARAPQHLEIIASLLEGTITYPGLKVDIDLRWLIVAALAGTGAAGDDLIAAELQRDPTDLGQRQAEAAKAARPTPAAKAEAWSRIRDDHSLPLATMNAIMRGFHHPDQANLLAAYAAPYFAALDGVWRERPIEVALAFARSMYPRVVVGADVLRMTDEHLAQPSVPGPLRRILLEGKDQMQRAIRARSLDAAAAPREGVDRPH